MTRKLVTFLLTTFLVSWSVALMARVFGLQDDQIVSSVLVVIIMLGPALGAVTCGYLFEPRGDRKLALGLLLQPNRWWLLAWLVAIFLGALSVIFTVLLSDRTFIGFDSEARHFSSPIEFFVVMLVGTISNAVILTLTEELGWRGYLYHLWKEFGFWKMLQSFWFSA
jgi:uncharacterized protein